MSSMHSILWYALQWCKSNPEVLFCAYKYTIMQMAEKYILSNCQLFTHIGTLGFSRSLSDRQASKRLRLLTLCPSFKNSSGTKDNNTQFTVLCKDQQSWAHEQIMKHVTHTRMMGAGITWWGRAQGLLFSGKLCNCTISPLKKSNSYSTLFWSKDKKE